VLDVIEDEGLLDRSTTIGETIRDRMLAWQERWPEIGEVRGLGAMLAIELISDPATKKPDKELANRVTEEALRRGLLLITCGVYGNAIRVLVPLVIADPELQEALSAWEEALEAVLGQ
jgi:4-aminobutyrate aminotransferase/(S)-3-amino-2-methylpropionate transaminase